MERPVRGAVLVLPFPFSDLSRAKRRPALVVAAPKGDDVILCQITSRSLRDDYAIAFHPSDFAEGGLRQESNVRPNRIFTADSRIVLYQAGRLMDERLQSVIDGIVRVLRE